MPNSDCHLVSRLVSVPGSSRPGYPAALLLIALLLLPALALPAQWTNPDGMRWQEVDLAFHHDKDDQLTMLWFAVPGSSISHGDREPQSSRFATAMTLPLLQRARSLLDSLSRVKASRQAPPMVMSLAMNEDSVTLFLSVDMTRKPGDARYSLGLLELDSLLEWELPGGRIKQVKQLLDLMDKALSRPVRSLLIGHRDCPAGLPPEPADRGIIRLARAKPGVVTIQYRIDADGLVADSTIHTLISSSSAHLKMMRSYFKNVRFAPARCASERVAWEEQITMLVRDMGLPFFTNRGRPAN